MAAALTFGGAAGPIRAESTATASDDGLASADGLYPELARPLGRAARGFLSFCEWRLAQGQSRYRRIASYWGVDTMLERENQSFIRELVESLEQE